MLVWLCLLLIAIIASLIGVVRIVWTRRPGFQFTLRTLLIIVCIISTFLALNRLVLVFAGPQALIESYVAFGPLFASAAVFALVAVYGVVRVTALASSHRRKSSSAAGDWQITGNATEGANSGQSQSPAARDHASRDD